MRCRARSNVCGKFYITLAKNLIFNILCMRTEAYAHADIKLAFIMFE